MNTDQIFKQVLGDKHPLFNDPIIYCNGQRKEYAYEISSGFIDNELVIGLIVIDIKSMKITYSKADFKNVTEAREYFDEING